MLRRLEKRILVGLPEMGAREAMFKTLMPEQIFTTEEHGMKLNSEIDYQNLAQVKNTRYIQELV